MTLRENSAMQGCLKCDKGSDIPVQYICSPSSFAMSQDYKYPCLLDSFLDPPHFQRSFDKGIWDVFVNHLDVVEDAFGPDGPYVSWDETLWEAIESQDGR
jgi:hypothetical protein